MTDDTAHYLFLILCTVSRKNLVSH